MSSPYKQSTNSPFYSSRTNQQQETPQSEKRLSGNIKSIRKLRAMMAESARIAQAHWEWKLRKNVHLDMNQDKGLS